jgi:hypothetical protein
MKKILLIALALSGSAFVTVERCKAQPTVLVSRPQGISFGFPAGYYGSPRYLNYYPYGYHRHPYVHYYPYSYYGSPYYRNSGHRTHRYHKHRYHRSY